MRTFFGDAPFADGLKMTVSPFVPVAQSGPGGPPLPPSDYQRDMAMGALTRLFQDAARKAGQVDPPGLMNLGQFYQAPPMLAYLAYALGSKGRRESAQQLGADAAFLRNLAASGGSDG